MAKILNFENFLSKKELAQITEFAEKELAPVKLQSRMKNNPAKTICKSCRMLTLAKLGIFEVLCDLCLSEKEELKRKENPTLFVTLKRPQPPKKAA